MAILIPEVHIDSSSFLPVKAGGFDAEVVFGRRAPLEIEVGCGNGHFLTGLAAERPEHDFLGIDLRYKRIEKSCRKADRLDFPNARFILADAYAVLGETIQRESVASVYVNFPDPWPKFKHRKFRLNTLRFVELLVRVLEPGGVLWWVCDHYPQILDVVGLCRVFERQGALVNRFDPEGVSTLQPDYPETLYEKKWRASGRPVFYVSFLKTGSVPG